MSPLFRKTPMITAACLLALAACSPLTGLYLLQNPKPLAVVQDAPDGPLPESPSPSPSADTSKDGRQP